MRQFAPILERLRPYRVPLLVLLIGLVLLLLPSGEKRTDHSAAAVLPEESIEQAQTRLAETLGKIDGVGQVYVLLSREGSAETEYLSDPEGTVVLSAGSGTQTAVVSRTVYPRYQGAVVVCTGGDQARVKLRVLEAVSNFTGLGSARISVFPLRGGK